MHHDGHAYRIDSINSQAVCIGARILASKVVRGNQTVQCNSGVVSCAQKCVEVVQMNCSLFLLNQLLEVALATKTRWPFSYSWLLILIALVSWMVSGDYQPMKVDAEKVCRGVRYQNLLWVKEPSQ